MSKIVRDSLEDSGVAQGAEMDDRIFTRFRELILKESGIQLSDKKNSLLQNRIGKRLRHLGLPSPQEYLKVVETDLSGDELIELIDAISTNVTYFYREPAHFELLTKIAQRWKEEKKSSVKFWCAASSSGEEPYTIAMHLAENLDLKVTDCKILATDICTPVLRKAIRGQYELNQLRDLPKNFCDRYFVAAKNDCGEPRVEVIDQLKKMVTYKKLNLAHHPIPLKGSIDIIMCRNVMIYFNRELREGLVKEFVKLLKPGGYLMVGHSENISGISSELSSVQPSAYRKLG